MMSGRIEITVQADEMALAQQVLKRIRATDAERLVMSALDERVEEHESRPDAFARNAVAEPIRPQPTMPSVRPRRRGVPRAVA